MPRGPQIRNDNGQQWIMAVWYERQPFQRSCTEPIYPLYRPAPARIVVVRRSRRFRRRQRVAGPVQLRP